MKTQHKIQNRELEISMAAQENTKKAEDNVPTYEVLEEDDEFEVFEFLELFLHLLFNLKRPHFSSRNLLTKIGTRQLRTQPAVHRYVHIFFSASPTFELILSFPYLCL